MSKEEDLFRVEPTPQAAWRWVVLMGANSRTYKFPLGAALLEHGAAGREDVPLAELAATYSMNIVRRLKDAPQAPEKTSTSATDFLTVAKEEADESLRLGAPTERLLRTAVDNMPRMVMQMFHHVRGGGEIPYQFYELRGRGAGRFVWLAPELRQIAASSQAGSLNGELDARWSIVETSFMSGVGRSLLQQGVSVDLQHEVLTDTERRRSVAGVRESLIGFQHGRCLICNDKIDARDPVAIDHTFPFALMERFNVRRAWPELDLDTVWNLAPAHHDCNAGKSDRPPAPLELERLAQRNEAIMHSPHPLKRTLETTLANGTRSFIGSRAWADFVIAVQRFFLS